MHKRHHLIFALLIVVIATLDFLGLWVALENRHLRRCSRYPDLAEIVLSSLVLFVLVIILINIVFAIVVFFNACRLEESANPPYLVGPLMWAVATLFGGVLGATLYWLINRPTLRLEQSSMAGNGASTDGLGLTK